MREKVGKGIGGKRKKGQERGKRTRSQFDVPDFKSCYFSTVRLSLILT